jgi:hypothetical protein
MKITLFVAFGLETACANRLPRLPCSSGRLQHAVIKHG